MALEIVALGAAVERSKAAGFVSVSPMNRARNFHTATLLPNGKVLVAGGDSSTTTELFDPVTRTWTLTGGLLAYRNNHRATLLPNGKVLIEGGEQANSSVLSSAELYEPDSVGTGPSLTILHDSNQIMSSYWSGAGTLEQTYSLTTTNWQPAPTQDDPHTIRTTDLMQFFRVKTD